MNWKKFVNKSTTESSSPKQSFGRSEIEKIVNKIREEYTEYSQLQPAGFKILEFESRYTQILKEKGDVQTFLLSEIDFLEKMKQVYHLQKKKAEIMKESPLNRILDEQESFYSHFPKIEFHPYARKEIKYFYGALKQFVERDLFVLELIFKGTPEMKDLKDSISNIEKMGKVFRTSPSLRIKEHMLKITERNGDPDFVEKESQLIIKDTCISLKSLEEAIEVLHKQGRVPDSMYIQFPHDPNKDFLENFRGLSFQLAADKIRDSSKDIISSFKMDWLYSTKKS
jgi:hypothetical protein